MLLRLAIVCAIVVAAAPAGAAVKAESSGLFTSAGALPVVSSRVSVEVRGPFAEVVVEQVFENDLERGVEAVYVFPLPADAAVRSMTIRTGDQTISAAIARREEARKAYEEAVAAGVVAGLTEQERANVFTQQVSGIGPGEQVTVELRFDASVGRYRDGWELVLPLVVAPRHVPGAATGDATRGTGTAPDTDVVEDASRVTPPVRSRGGNPIDVTIDLGAVAAADVDVPTHDADVQTRRGRTTVRVRDARSDRDLVVRWRSADRGGARALVERGAGAGGVVAVVVETPRPAKRREARRWVLVLDASGSVAGDALVALRAAGRALVERTGDEPLAIVTAPGALSFRKGKDGKAAARKQIDAIAPRGATALGDLVAAALADDAEDLAIVVVTDGLVADDAQVAARVDGAKARVHAIGVGSAPNRWLLDELARRGRGVSLVLAPGDDVGASVGDLVAAAAAPPVTPAIDWGGLAVADQTPSTVPALAAGRAAVITARVDRLADATIRVTAGASRFTAKLRAAAAEDGRLLARRWARGRVDELVAASAAPDEIVRLGLEHELVTPYTALVAKGTRVAVEGGVRTTVAIPVAMPAGMRWQSVFGPEGDTGTLSFDADDAAGAPADEETIEVEGRAPAIDATTLESAPGRAYGEAVMVHGRVYLTRLWTGSVGVDAGRIARADETTGYGALSAGAYRRLSRSWRAGVSGRLQVAPGLDAGTDVAVYATTRATAVVGETPLLTLDLGAGAILDEPGFAWRLGLRLGPWPFAPLVGVDQARVDGEARTSVGVGIDWSF